MYKFYFNILLFLIGFVIIDLINSSLNLMTIIIGLFLGILYSLFDIYIIQRIKKRKQW